jgi:hypothetical protein
VRSSKKVLNLDNNVALPRAVEEITKLSQTQRITIAWSFANVYE